MHRTTRAAAALSFCAVAATTGLAACGGASSDQAPTPKPKALATPAAPGTVVVPQLVGVEQGDAHRLVARAGLDMRAIGYVGKYGNGRYNVSCVKVISQSPVAGERRKKGAIISVIEKECETPQAAPVPPAGTASPGQSSRGGITSSTST